MGAQLVALEKAKTEKEAHGEFESEHPGYCGAQVLVTGGERTLPQQVKLILVETSFEAEQKSIVAMTRRIDRFLIDQHGIDQSVTAITLWSNRKKL